MAQQLFPYLRVAIEPVIPFSQGGVGSIDKLVTLSAVGGGGYEDRLLLLTSEGGALHHWWSDYELLSDQSLVEV